MKFDSSITSGWSSKYQNLSHIVQGVLDELWCTDHRSFLLTSSSSCLSTLAPILVKSTFYSVSIEHLIKGEEYSEGNSWALLFSLRRFESPAGRGRKLGPNLTHRSAKPGLVSTTAPRRYKISEHKIIETQITLPQDIDRTN